MTSPLVMPGVNTRGEIFEVSRTDYGSHGLDLQILEGELS